MSRYFTTVRANEKLSDIANRFTGNPNLWPMIVDVNYHLSKRAIQYQGRQLVTLTDLVAGQKLYIPDQWINNRSLIGLPELSGTLAGHRGCRTCSGCSGCKKGCNTCSGGCDYPYGNRDNPPAPCGAFETSSDLGTCGRIRTDAYIMGAVGDAKVPSDVNQDYQKKIEQFINMPVDDCKKQASDAFADIKSSQVYPVLVKKYGSDEEVKARYDIVTQAACNEPRENINPQPIYSKPMYWVWLGGAALAGVIVGKVLL